MNTALMNIILIFSLITSGGAGSEESGPNTKTVEYDQSQSITEADLWVRQTLAKMTLKEKKGQMLVTGIEKEYLSDKEGEMIQSGRVGGLIFLGHNIESKDQFESLLSTLPEPTIPMFLSVDQEGGRVERLPAEKEGFMSAFTLGQNPDLAYEEGQKLGQAVRAYGLNLNFAPVLDVYSNPENKVIGTRAYGSDPELVARVGLDVMKGMRSQGVIPCVKHFPGHGDTSLDSHENMPIVNHGLERLMSFEWLPFKLAIDNDVPMIMTAHIKVDAIDADYPATLSYKLISGHLRGSLGYEGLIITDDLIMGAISKNYSDDFVAMQTVLAGVDLLLISDNSMIENMTWAIESAVEEGIIPENRIDESVTRILRLKYNHLVAPKSNQQTGDQIEDTE